MSSAWIWWFFFLNSGECVGSGNLYWVLGLACSVLWFLMLILVYLVDWKERTQKENWSFTCSVLKFLRSLIIQGKCPFLSFLLHNNFSLVHNRFAHDQTISSYRSSTFHDHLYLSLYDVSLLIHLSILSTTLILWTCV